MVDISWITACLAVGGGLWRRENLAEVARAGVTHIINTQIEFSERALLGADDDFQPNPADYFRQAIRFALDALAAHQAARHPEGVRQHGTSG
ncbi:MAG: hypothetical protein ACE5H2_09820 [Terriglobia bacterium]